MVDIFGSLLDRPLINDDFKSRYPCLMKMIEEDLDEVKKIFDNRVSEETETGLVSVNKNMPTVAGALKWAQELRNRLKTPLNNMKLSFSQRSYQHFPLPNFFSLRKYNISLVNASSRKLKVYPSHIWRILWCHFPLISPLGHTSVQTW